MTQAFLALLIAVRAAAYALVVAIDNFEVQAIPLPGPNEDKHGACLHREDHRNAQPTGNYRDRWMCTRCNYIELGERTGA